MRPERKLALLVIGVWAVLGGAALAIFVFTGTRVGI